jgi:L-alanine-DL-glutamate epimerase-like enolase superfamily enzyme
MPRASDTPIERVAASAYDIPTDAPESDGTLEWNHTTLVVAHLSGGGQRGMGYTYSTAAAARVIHEVLRPALRGIDAFAIPLAFAAMRRAVRNLGQPGIAYAALSAVDAALWDLKGKLLDLPVVKLLGPARDAVPVYGSGGFTSYDVPRLCEQLGGYAERGFRFVKMKIGRDPKCDLVRVRAARNAIGPGTELFVDANGAYDRKLALAQSVAFSELDVRWFEEPVSSEDLEGLRLLRDRAPAGMHIAAGEYGCTAADFQRLLDAGAVDVLQADATRCGGITGFSRVAALVDARSMDVSAHCAPALHVHVGCSVPRLRHLEYFYDHARIEPMLFEGCPAPRDGRLAPDLSRPGLGLELKATDAARFRIAAYDSTSAD